MFTERNLWRLLTVVVVIVAALLAASSINPFWGSRLFVFATVLGAAKYGHTFGRREAQEDIMNEMNRIADAMKAALAGPNPPTTYEEFAQREDASKE